MRRIYVGLAFLLMLAVVAQFYLAAVGAFDTGPKDDAFSAHRTLGYLIMLVAVLATIAAALARLPGKLIGLTGLITVLVLVQGVIRMLADAFSDAGDTSTTAGSVVFGLHALNALAIMGAAGAALRAARSQPQSSSSATVDTAAERPSAS